MKLASIFLVLLLESLIFAQTSAAPLRAVKGQTLVSSELPAADLTFSKDFRYVGGQIVNLYGNADAEQHLFVKAGPGGVIERFYWLQFEHFLPSNTYKYEYDSKHTTNIGGLSFVYDVKSFSDYAADLPSDPASDGYAIAKLLAQHKLSFAAKTARVRMFHSPTTDGRTELMIIYGEALVANSKIPASTDGIALDAAYPDLAKMVLDHMRDDISIKKR